MENTRCESGTREKIEPRKSNEERCSLDRTRTLETRGSSGLAPFFDQNAKENGSRNIIVLGLLE